MSDPALIVGDSMTDPNLFYTTHFLAGDPFIYLQSNGRRLLVTSSMELGRAEKESTVPEVRSFNDFGYRELLKKTRDRGQAFREVVTAVIRDAGLSAVTVEPTFPVQYADSLRADGIEVKVAPDLFSEERRSKTEEEIRAIEEAQRAAERVTAEAIDMIRRSDVRHGVLYLAGEPLTSERVRAEMEVALTREGMDVSQGLIVAGGPGGAEPHWEGSGPLRANEPIIFDVFPRSKRTRYFADMTRTVVKGKASPKVRAMYGAVMQAMDAALSQVKAGVNGRDVHASVEAAFEQAGYGGEGPGPRFTHGTGHGVGLDVHEAPGLGAYGVPLIENDVVTVEPGLYDPEIGGVRMEDLVVVTRDGYRNLTRFPTELEV